MAYHYQYKEDSWGRIILLGILMIACFGSRAEQTHAFVLSGTVQDVFRGKQDLSASFKVKTFGSNALIYMTFDNGFQEDVGTDGRNTFTYIPFTGDRSKIAHPNGQATISNGRFPSNAHEFEQFLWLLCVSDPELITNVNAHRFQFYAAFHKNDMHLQVSTNHNPPCLITSIKWYAPNFIWNGAKHYPLALYPHGWLKAELAVKQTNSVDHESIPASVTFTQYETRPVGSNDIRFAAPGRIGSIAIRSPMDVVPVEFTVFSITNVQVSSPLSSYIPKILDKTALVDDHRLGGKMIRVASGKWWTDKELYERHRANEGRRKR